MSKIIRAGRIDDAEGVEISVVDRPSNGKSKIKSVSIAKRAAEMELNPEALKAIGATPEEAGFLKRLFGLFSKKSTGESAGTDGHGGYLVTDEDGKKHLPTESNGKRDHKLMGAAWAALHGGYRGKKYDGPDKDKAISRLTAMYEEEGMETPSEKMNSVHDLRKSLYDVGRLAEMVQSLDYMWQCSAAEREWEGDNSPVPEKIAEVRDVLGRILLEMAEEELNELKPAKGAE
jgi:hypothetical protein